MLNCYYAHAEQDDGAQVTPRVPALLQGVCGCAPRRRGGAAGPATPSANAARVRRRERASSSRKSWAGVLAAAAALHRRLLRCWGCTRGSAAPTAGRDRAARSRACGGPGARSRGAGAAQGPRLQRRCYWLLESEDDIVLVHYLNVDKSKGRPEEAPPGIEHELARRLGTTVTSGVAPVRPRPAARTLRGAPSPGGRPAAETSALLTLTAGLCLRGGCCRPASALARALPLSGCQVGGAPRAPASGATARRQRKAGRRLSRGRAAQLGAPAPPHLLRSIVPPPHGAGDPFVPLLPTMSFEAFFGGGANGNGVGARAPTAAPAPAPDALLAAWDELGVSRSGSGSRGSSRGLALLAQGLVPSLDSLGSVGDWQVRARAGRRACIGARGGGPAAGLCRRSAGHLRSSALL
jgi:hypothetical protein